MKTEIRLGYLVRQRPQPSFPATASVLISVQNSDRRYAAIPNATSKSNGKIVTGLTTITDVIPLSDRPFLSMLGLKMPLSTAIGIASAVSHPFIPIRMTGAE